MRQDGKSLGQIGKYTLAKDPQRLRSVIRTLVAKKLLRPEHQLLRGCMDNADKFADKWISLWGQYSQTVANAGVSVGGSNPGPPD